MFVTLTLCSTKLEILDLYFPILPKVFKPKIIFYNNREFVLFMGRFLIFISLLPYGIYVCKDFC